MPHRLSRPSELAGHVEGSRNWAITRLTINALARETTMGCTALSERHGDQLAMCFEEFYEALTATGHDLGWTLPCEFAEYLGVNSEAMWHEMLIKAGLRWLRRADAGRSWLALRALEVPGSALAFVRKPSLSAENEIFQLSDHDRRRSSGNGKVEFARGHGDLPEQTTEMDWESYEPVLLPPL